RWGPHAITPRQARRRDYALTAALPQVSQGHGCAAFATGRLLAVEAGDALGDVALGKRLGHLHGGLEVRLQVLDGHVAAEEVRRDELGEGSRGLVEAARIAHVTGQRAIGVIDELVQMAGNRGVTVAYAIGVQWVHPQALVHRFPELVHIPVGEVLLDTNEG